MAKFDPKQINNLKTTLLGNSGYIIIRPTPDSKEKYEYLYASSVKLKTYTETYLCGPALKNEEQNATEQNHEIQDKDIILMFSDGVSNNIDNDDRQKCLLPNLDGNQLTDA